MTRERSTKKIEADELKVFISYSRQNIAFVDRLQAALREQGVEATVDRTEIAKGEAWWTRLQQLIIEADSVVFVLSPGSVRSEVCQREVDFAEKLKKRIVPVVAEDIAGQNVPEALARLNYLFFIPHIASGTSGDFEIAVGQLVDFLQTDIEWIREHTRLGTLAQRWSIQGQGRDLLLWGAELRAAEEWITKRPLKAPDPSDAHLAFLAASRRAETQRQRWLVGGALAVALGAVVLAGVAYLQSVEAGRQRETAEKRRLETDEIRKQAQTTESGLLAKSASQLTDDVLGGDSAAAMLLALEALPDETSPDAQRRDRPYVPEAEFELDRAQRNLRESIVFSGHASSVSGAAWSPDGTRVITASDDGTARVWEMESGKVIARIMEQCPAAWPICPIRKPTWSPDGTRVLTVSARTRVWDAATGNKISDLGGSEANADDEIHSAEWSSNGKWIVTVSHNGMAQVWEAANGRKISQFNCIAGHAKTAAWSPEGGLIVTTCKDNTARVWDWSTGNELRVLAGHTAQVSTAAFDKAGRRIVTASQDETARVWDIMNDATPVVLYSTREPGILMEAVVEAAFSPEGARILTVHGGGKLRIWDATNGKEMASIIASDGTSVPNASFSPDGKNIVTKGFRNVKVWGVETGKELARLDGHQNQIFSVVWSPDGSRILTASYDGTARIWSPWQRKHTLALKDLKHDGTVNSVAWSPDGKRIVTASDDQVAKIWDTESGKPISILKGHADTVIRAVWNPEGTHVVTTSADKTAKIWEASTGISIATLVGHVGGVWCAAWSPDGRRVITTAHDDRVARIWEAASGKEEVTLTGHDSMVGCAAWSPDGTRVVTVSYDKTARIWEPASGNVVAKLEGHEGAVVWVAWSSDGTRLFTICADKPANAWRLNEWELSTSEKSLIGFLPIDITSVEWSQDRSRFVTTSRNYKTQVWDSRSGTNVAVIDDVFGNSASFSLDGSRLAVAWFETAVVLRVPFKTNDRINAARMQAPRCLSWSDRRQFFLASAPELWCVERRLWPYHGDDWQAWLQKQKAWLASGRQGEAPPLPEVR